MSDDAATVAGPARIVLPGVRAPPPRPCAPCAQRASTPRSARRSSDGSYAARRLRGHAAAVRAHRRRTTSTAWGCSRAASSGSAGTARLPHMGWNDVEPRASAPPARRRPARLSRTSPTATPCRDAGRGASPTTEVDGVRFASLVAAGRVAGAQFHPERSSRRRAPRCCAASWPVERCCVGAIIPCLDVSGGRVVKGVNFVNLRDCGDPVAAAVRYAGQGADEICWLNITAGDEDLARPAGRRSSRPPTRSTCRSPSAAASRMSATCRDLLPAGADKVSINTAALRRPGLVDECADRHGIAVHRGRHRREAATGARWRAYASRRAPARPAATRSTWAREAVERGAGELFVTCMDTDGTGRATRSTCWGDPASAVPVPVIASGGAAAPGAPRRRARGGRSGRSGRLDLPRRPAHVSEVKEEVHAMGAPVRR